MSDPKLLKKAREILAHAKQGPISEPTTMQARGKAPVIEPAATNTKQIYWERADGLIYGPAKPEFLAQGGTGLKERFWIVLTFHNSVCWVRSDRLRSRQTFDDQISTAHNS
jgi:hypothetical protein